MRRTPLKRKRETPRRKAPERVPQRKPKPVKSQAEKDFHAAVARMPCLVCGRHPVHVHHVTASIHGGRFTRSHWLVVPLCPMHHKVEFGPLNSVEALSHGGFYLAHGVDLLAEAQRIVAKWEADRGRPAHLLPTHEVPA